MTLQQILEEWDEQKPFYEKFTKYIALTLDEISQNQGILVRILSRTKDEVSIAKNLYKKGVTSQNYFDMIDKSGARVICRFKEDTLVIANCIRKEFEILKEEDKSDILELNEIGYKSLHFDIRLREENTPEEIFREIGHISGEIQVRTLCEDVWAEINHDLGYKPLTDLSPESARQIYCLGGIFEIADDCFSNINRNIIESSILDEYYALRILESPFIKLVKKEYDRELSYLFLKILLPILGINNPIEFKKIIQDFIDTNNEKIKGILIEREINVNYFPYLTQPELFLIFLLIEKDEFTLIEQWEKKFPIDDLEKLSIWWGHPLSDILDIE